MPPPRFVCLLFLDVLSLTVPIIHEIVLKRRTLPIFFMLTLDDLVVACLPHVAHGSTDAARAVLHAIGGRLGQVSHHAVGSGTQGAFLEAVSVDGLQAEVVEGFVIVQPERDVPMVVVLMAVVRSGAVHGGFLCKVSRVREQQFRGIDDLLCPQFPLYSKLYLNQAL
jgi:hypothetical protein